MKLNVYIRVFFIVSSIWAFTCDYKYHFWKPFFGEHAENDFIAGTDVRGRKSYIAKVIPPFDKRSWTISTELTFDYVEFAYEDKKVRLINRFIEILSVEPQYYSKFSWVAVNSELELRQIEQRSSKCLVEGGIFKANTRVITSYIGRVIDTNGSLFVGPVFIESWSMLPGFYFLKSARLRYRKSFFQVLMHTP